MNKLNLGSFELPINAATKSFAILAKRGAGKSYTGAVMAEEFAKNGIPFVVFDPIDVWWGLRLAANGKDKGLPVVVFGVRNADIQLDRDMGRQIAQAIVKENISCVISTFGMPKVAQRHLIAEFADELLNINNTPRHVFIEEAHEFVPQRIQAGMGKTFSAVEALVTMGRNVGIGVTMLNQRAATLNKDVLTQIDTLLAFRNLAPQDRKALHEWVEVKAAEGDFDKFIKSLPDLPTGEGWIWSPEFLGVFKRIKIRKRETFHPDREKLGVDFKMPELTQTDIQGFINKFKSEKPVEEKKGKKLPKTDYPIPQEDITNSGYVVSDLQHEQVVRDLKNDFESKMIEKDTEIKRLQSVIHSASSILTGGSGTMNQAPGITHSSNVAINLWKSKLGNGLGGRLFALFIEHPQMEFTREQIALAIGAPPRSGHFSNEMAKLTRNKLVNRNGSVYKLNPNL